MKTLRNLSRIVKIWSATSWRKSLGRDRRPPQMAAKASTPTSRRCQICREERDVREDEPQVKIECIHVHINIYQVDRETLLRLTRYMKECRSRLEDFVRFLPVKISSELSLTPRILLTSIAYHFH